MVSLVDGKHNNSLCIKRNVLNNAIDKFRIAVLNGEKEELPELLYELERYHFEFELELALHNNERSIC